jgi:hypothetical protein
MDMQNSNYTTAGILGAVWAVTGFSLILVDAIIRLSGIAMQAISSGLTVLQWLTLLGVVLVMAYAEGYRGFQKSFSPRCAARVWHLLQNPHVFSAILAPLFIMGFFRATRKPLLFAWVGTALIVMLIVILQISPQPWRGIVDAGVVVGLSWGLLSFLISVQQTLAAAKPPVSAEVPESGSV